ncbi:hypothetical protein RS84_00270 [Microbacterium hydrocarbonoxydans]|uniref:DUF3263 domain-containing protein n=1 Tax=Microbacterium hydrocarbonoxydans TaxID=273678 RepID=A0A0M2HXJ8_9MICO|nr:DUF3263 domain-containing protein [Microbacterium hydrocarbonoxydans]KJL49158.1 hypothetical protein RS84_00270 [Microbacterium hydrocarbonoxydans]
MSPDILLAFEERHPGNSPAKRERIRRDLGLSDIRYYQLLNRAASSPEGIAAHPFTARRVRERAATQTRARVMRIGA